MKMSKVISLISRKKEERQANIFITGQKGSGVSSVASAFAGIKPESDPLSTNGIQNWFFQKGRYNCNLTEMGNQDRQLKWGDFVGESHALVYVVDSMEGTNFEKDRKNLANLARMEGVWFRSLLIVFNKYGEKGSLRKSELKGLVGFRDVRRRWHGMVKIVTTRATSFNKFRPIGIWKGIRFLFYYIKLTFSDLEGEIDNYRRKNSIEQKVQREKRRCILDKIRNEELTTEVGSSKSTTFTLKESRDTTNVKNLQKKAQSSPVKSSKEVSSSKPKADTKKATKKEIQETKTAHKKTTFTNSHTQIISKQSVSTTTIQKTNKNQSGKVTSDTENQVMVSQNITIPLKNMTLSKNCGDATKTPITFNIKIDVNEELLKGLRSQGLTMTINLAKE